MDKKVTSGISKIKGGGEDKGNFWTMSKKKMLKNFDDFPETKTKTD